MRLRNLVPLLFLAIAAVAAADDAYAPGEVLVKFRPGTALTAKFAISALGARSIEEIDGIGVSRLALPGGSRVLDAVQYLRKQSNVLYAEPNYAVQAFFDPNDPFYASKQYAPQKIQCPGGWDITKGSSSVVIAIIDTGIDATHPDLAGKVVGGYNFVAKNTNTADDNGHGTHCAGIAAAATNNGIGIAGIGYNCAVMPVKVLAANGSGYVSDVVSGIKYAADNGAKVASLSLGGSSGSSTQEDAVNYAWGKGVVVVAAAGNAGNTSLSYPGAYVNAIAVGATDQNDAKASFSSYGNSWVDVAAPGVAIYSTVPTFVSAAQYESWSGTSMATPAVAGLAGLVWSKAPAGSTNTQVRSWIESNCDPVGLSYWAKGRVNAYKALQAISGGGGGGGGGGGTPTEKNFDAIRIEPYPGEASAWRGALNTVFKLDGTYFELDSVKYNTWQFATGMATFTMDGPASGFSELNIRVSAQGPTGGQGYVWLRDFSRNAYVLLASFTMSPTDKSLRNYKLTTNIGNYVGSIGGAANSVQVLVECDLAGTSRKPAQKFTLKNDVISLMGKTK